MLRVILPALMTIVAVSGLFAVSLGRVTALEGELSVTRAGKLLEAARLKEGLELETDDLLATGTLGRLEFTINAGGVAATCKLGSDSSLALDLSSLKKEQTTALELIGGSLTLKLTSVSGNSHLEIRTTEAIFSSRAGAFSVVCSLGGEWAVSASTGKVQCQVGNLAYQAEPGVVVVVSPNPPEARSFLVNVNTIESWNQSWTTAMASDIRNRALASCRFFASRYLQTSGQFQRAWNRWEREGRDLWGLWALQDTTGTQSSASLVVETKTMAGLLVPLRRLGTSLERDSFRLSQLRTLVQQGVLSEGLEVSKGYTLKEFYRQLDRDLPEAFKRQAMVRWMHKSYLQRTGGEFPAPVLVPGISRDSPFFH
jgi:hypothetical protein